ncbi:hypothetical protein KIN20_000205 [Parelaphostrongylus tenuis]|uniref:Uncharacterized protein n=1 Tax=Parelaphostrongylus tenuis TaxID=148309 RepID=A0AAD5MKB3_PARTN|nr:hypothetical protein KIN20_000205 [Parelaphostrongylus tenuis]
MYFFLYLLTLPLNSQESDQRPSASPMVQGALESFYSSVIHFIHDGDSHRSQSVRREHTETMTDYFTEEELEEEQLLITYACHNSVWEEAYKIGDRTYERRRGGVSLQKAMSDEDGGPHITHLSTSAGESIFGQGCRGNKIACNSCTSGE